MTDADSRTIIEGAIYLAGCGFAVWKGRWPERLVAGAMIVEFFISLAIRRVQPLETPRYLNLGTELCVLATVLYVAFRTDLRWALLASALQILSVLALITRVLDPSIHSWAFVTVAISLGYLLMATVMFGAVMQIRARQKSAAPA